MKDREQTEDKKIRRWEDKKKNDPNFPTSQLLNFQTYPPIRNQNGSAIIITVLIVTILVALVVEFAYEVYIDTAALSNWTNAQKASLIAKSGQAICFNYIKMIKSDNILSEAEFPVDRDLGPNTQLIIKIEDENAKFNINSLIKPNGKEDKDAIEFLQKLFEYLNINTNLALVIADWIDADSESKLPDSEDNAKNAYMQSLEELGLIKGISKDVFVKVAPYITVSEKWPSEINMNTATLPVLASFKDLSEPLAKRIIDYRMITPFEDRGKMLGQINTVIGKPFTSTNITNNSSYFRVTSKATVNEITRVIESIVDRSRNIQSWREQ